jgi:hypothetical protein
MNSTLNNFFKEERKRVFEPGPYFAKRVLARLSEKVPTVWDVIPRAVRPIMALSLVLLFGVLAVQIVVPVESASTGPILAVVGQDLTPGEWMLFVDAKVPSDAQLDELNLLEPVDLVP